MNNIIENTYENTDDKLQNYINYLNDKCYELIKNEKKLKKVDNDVVSIPKYNNYSILLEYNYNVNNLKQFSKFYKLKQSGNKSQLLVRLFSYLYLSCSAIKIQKLARSYLCKKYIKSHGPAFKNRQLCTNNSDFFTMDELVSLPYSQFFSYKDIDGFIYGFDIISFNNLIYKSNGLLKNPYNRHDISNEVIIEFRKLLRLSKLLNIDITININDINDEISSKKSLELRVVSLFQKMDELGNYTNYMWFMNLNRNQLVKILRELFDVWVYRAPLTEEVKRKICPPNGNPFGRIHINNLNNLLTLENIDEARKIVLDILEKFIISGIDNDSKCLGSYYVLGSLTLVSHDAASALPWLFQAFNYM